jgi:lipooligosaccharide transport system ATP-binding protein
MTGPVIQVANVYKTFGKVKAVGGLSFNVPEAVCFGLLGPNGAGKTTLMRMIYGVCRRDRLAGSAISVFNNDPGKNAALAIKFVAGVVPQENNLDEELNVEQNLRIFARFYNLPVKKATERIEELLTFMELGDKKKARIRELSGGMKRRLIIARALLNGPRLLILDEPTTGLDPQVRHLIWEKLRSLKKYGMTILLTTHYMEEAFQICDSVLIMNKGESVMEGNPQRLVADHIEPFVLEIFKKEAFAAVSNSIPPECTRIDDTTDIVRIYSCNQSGLQEMGKLLKPGDFFLRQSNLEDLFIKTTGSALNVNQ